MAMFLRRVLITSLAVAATTVAGMVVVAPQAEAAFPGESIIIRPGDFIRPTGTLGAATMQVESDGVHIHTSAPSDLATATFDAPYHPSLDVLLTPYYPDVEYQWTGTADQPGIHFEIDLDQDGQADLELVGEHLYGNDMWLNREFYVANPTVPMHVFRAAAPCIQDQPQRQGRSNCSAGYGDRYHGDINDWASGLVQRFPSAGIVRGGFTATGGQIDGVLSGMNIGLYSFRFTTDPRHPASLTMAVSPAHVTVGANVTISGQVANTGNYPHVVLQQKTPGGSWQDVAERTFTQGPTYDFTWTVSTVGVVKFRTEVRRDSILLRTVSDVISVRVTDS